MRTSLRRTRAALAVAVAGAMAAACSAQGGLSAARPAAADAKIGGTLTIGLTEPGSLDPANAYDPAGQQVIATMCDPLLQYDPLTAKLQPGLATFWISTSQGGQLTVRLRGGVHYSTGGTVNATDVVDELSRVASVDTASYAAGALQLVKGFDVISGQADSKSSDALKHLTGVNALSDSSFAVSLSKHDSSFVYVLAHLLASPVPHKLAAATSFASHPVCAGPYELTGPWHAGDKQIVLRKNPHYYGKNNVYTNGGAGYADTIVVNIFASRSAELAAFAAGQVDIAQVPDDALPKPLPSGGSLVSAANGFADYLGLPSGNPVQNVFARPDVHLALSQALDRTAIGQAAYGGGSLPATGFLPPTVGDSFQPNACGAATPATADVAAARRTLSTAGISLTGQPLTLYYNDDYQNAAVAKAVAAQWHAAVGLNVTLKAMPWTDYLQKASGPQGFDGAFLESWTGATPSADSYLTPLLGTDAVGTSNFAHYVSPDFQRSLTTAHEATTASGRLLDFRALVKQTCSALPLLPLVFRQWHYVVRSSKVGSALNSFTDAASGLLDLREVYVR
jgi:oligopeptide transport system substrate-binding protein